MNEIVSRVFSADFLFIVLRVSTPLIFASMAALISRKAGVVNITIDGTMLTCALVSVLVSAFTQNLWLAILAGMVTGMLMGGFLAFFHIKMKTAANLTGVAINLLTTGGTVFLCYVFAHDKGSTANLKSMSIPSWDIPLIKDIPFVGQVLSGHNAMTYLALLSVLLVYLFIYKTPTGLRIRAVGEYAKAAESVGENSGRIKILSLVIAGMLASFGGMFMSMGYVSIFTKGMTASRGFIGVAAEAIGGGKPLFVLLASFLFGVAEAASNILQMIRIPIEIVLMLPYVVTLVVLIANSAKGQQSEKRRRKKMQKELLTSGKIEGLH